MIKDTHGRTDALIKVTLDYAPTTNGKKARKWFEEHGMVFFGVGRRAWWSDGSTYFRDALGMAYTESGESFLFYEDDLSAESEPQSSPTPSCAAILERLPNKHDINDIESGSDLIRNLKGGTLVLKAQKAGYNQAIDEATKAIKELFGEQE